MCDQHDNSGNDKKQVIKTPDVPPEGSWQTKVPLGCAISKSIHSSPMVKD